MAVAAVPSLGKVIVIGGCGFLGQNIVSLLLERHPQTTVSVVDLRTTNNRHPSGTVSYNDVDITDLAAVKAVFAKEKPDVVIHTASPLFSLGKNILLKVNLDGTKNLLEAAKEVGVKAFVYTSSASVIQGKDLDLFNADEEYPVVAGKEQSIYYTTTKVYAENEVLAANRSTPSFLTCSIRPAGIFGEGDTTAIPKMVETGLAGRTKVQLGPNENLFDWTHVKNVAHAHLLAANALLQTHKMLPTVPLDSERVDGEAFFITNDQPIYFWDFTRQIWKEAGVVTPINKVYTMSPDFAVGLAAIMEWVMWIFGKEPALTIHNAKFACCTRFYKIDKAKRRLGYRPIVDLEDGIRGGVADYMRRRKEAAEKKAQ